MIDLEHLGPVVVVRLARPEKRNAQTPEMLSSLTREIRRLGEDPEARAVVLSGRGEVFCSGFDLSLCRDDAGVLSELLFALSHATRAMRECPLPIVVSAHGGAIAGGCALAAAADFALTDAGAKLGYPVVRLGISPAVNVPALHATIGPGPARVRALDPGLVSGREAHRLGLVHECVEDWREVEPRAIALARDLAAKPAQSLAQTKRWLNMLDYSTDASRLDQGLHASLALVGTTEQTQRLAELWKKP